MKEERAQATTVNSERLVISAVSRLKVREVKVAVLFQVRYRAWLVRN